VIFHLGVVLHFHVTRIATTTATRFRFCRFLWVSLRGGLGRPCCKRSQQETQNKDQGSFTGSHNILLSQEINALHAGQNAPTRLLFIQRQIGRSLNQENTTLKVSRSTVTKEWNNVGVFRLQWLFLEGW
jgi:hypothetical protein